MYDFLLFRVMCFIYFPVIIDGYQLCVCVCVCVYAKNILGTVIVIIHLVILNEEGERYGGLECEYCVNHVIWRSLF